MLKNFLSWFKTKENIHNKQHKPPFFKEGEIWWCYFGENVGIEINGKGDYFTRPIYIYKKYDRYSFLGLPLTTKEKTGTWYCNINFNEIKQTIILSQGRTIDYKRLKEKIGELNKQEKERIREMYLLLHKK